ncbi:MAG: gamma carbonic anhydrase family protein [Candidatus Izemoplasmatales bacterium]|jgi:carbonic anhydrase/acetyltransferase-like protein (isoleucine patch superfamily)|nr:gamma carbonic anhydrase family protein [Candidatus Izemoplasmatales bacterium]
MIISAYKDKIPNIQESAKIFDGAVVVGDVLIHESVSIWYNTTIRGDMARVEIGKYTNIQDNAVIHTNTNLPTIIGHSVTVGHSAIIHAATVKDHALIGMGSIILDGAVISEYAMVGAGCLVPPGKIVPPRTLVLGNPMRIVRELTDEEISNNNDNINHYLLLMKEYGLPK